MVKLFKKNELLFSIIVIVIYVVGTSIFKNKYGDGHYMTLLFFVLLTVIILAFIKKNKLQRYFSLERPNGYKQFLYFIPLVIIGTVNFWNGVTLDKSTSYPLYILSMLFVGFLEEIIFRGFLFKAIAKTNLKEAIIITSITFGLGHIANLVNGAAVLETVLQMMYAMSLGYLFVVIMLKSKSLFPSIICHGVVNVTSIFGVESSDLFSIVTSIILIIISMGYAVYVNKIPEEVCE